MKKHDYHIPDHVYKFISIQVSSLSHSPYFQKDSPEDIFQELFVRYFVKSSAFIGKSEDFVFISIKNLALDLLNEKKSIKRSLLSEVSLEQIESNGAIFSKTEDKYKLENELTIKEILEELPEKDKMICTLILEGATSDEISKKLKISKSTIYKTFRNLQKKFIF